MKATSMTVHKINIISLRAIRGEWCQFVKTKTRFYNKYAPSQEWAYDKKKPSHQLDRTIRSWLQTKMNWYSPQEG